MSTEQNVARTVLDEDAYERFTHLAAERDLPIEEATRQALTAWMEREAVHEPAEPLFRLDPDFLAEDDGPVTDASKTDESLFGGDPDVL